MTYQKLIHDYLAGELSQEEEEKLFDGLSRHAEWREEMQLQLQMERAMEQDLHSVTVPPNATGAVFASLGFRRPAKWSQRARMSDHPFRGAAIARWPARSMILSGLAGMMLVAGSAYFFLPSHEVAKSPRAIAHSMNVPGIGAGKEALPGTRGNDRIAEHGVRNSSMHSAFAVRHSPIAALPMPKPAGIANSDSSKAVTPPSMPDEPLRYYSDFGNLYSVHYLTPQKIIGVSYRGQIFISEDSGHTWAPKQSGVSADLFGIHFFDRTYGIAVGAQGTIVRTSDAGESWRTVASGTTATLSTVRFITPDTAYICGDAGVMLRSTTGGTSWELLRTGIHANLFRMEFRNGMEGDVYGANDAHIATTDGGRTWNSIQ
ncbi:MAG TPA: YCF48-related protein [Candidatus Kapabacteria bacterium]|nr:YCF48-related protein [Candidatus Kapabacteria bacterium]